MSETDQLVQISQRSGSIARVPRDEIPTIELHLAPGQYVANVALERRVLFHSERKTDDWTWTAYVVTPLGVPVDG